MGSCIRNVDSWSLDHQGSPCKLKKKKRGIYFLAVLGLRCCMEDFSSCGEWGLLFLLVHRLHIVVASLVGERGL